MAKTKKASELRPGDRFGDPHREPYSDGRLRPAKVVKVIKTYDDEQARRGRVVLLELDDNTKWSPWVASYPVNQKLELA